MKIRYILAGIFLIIIQTTLIFKFFSIGDIYPSLIKVFLVLIALKTDLKTSLKYGILFGILEDLYMNELFLYNTLTNIVVVYFVEKVKYQLDFEEIPYGIILIVFVSLLDISIKTAMIFAKTGIFYISATFLLYALLNTIVYLGFRVVLIR